MAAGDGDYRARRVDARTWQHALVDRALEAEYRSAHVTNGGEAAQQRSRGLGPSQYVEMADISRQERRGCWTYEHRMPVHVDQPRHQRAPTAIDDPGVGAGVCRNRILRNLLDRIST